MCFSALASAAAARASQTLRWFVKEDGVAWDMAGNAPARPDICKVEFNEAWIHNF